MTFTVFGMSMMMIGFFIATLLTTARSAYTTSYAFFLAGFVFQMFFSDASLVKLLYAESLPEWAVWVKYVLSLYPPFNFALVMTDISAKSSPHYTSISRMWTTGSGYSWNDLVSSRTGYISGRHYWVPPSLLSLGIILLDSLIFMLLAWYFDHVLPSNRGKGSSICFFLHKKHWRRRRVRTDPLQPLAS